MAMYGNRCSPQIPIASDKTPYTGLPIIGRLVEFCKICAVEGETRSPSLRKKLTAILGKHRNPWTEDPISRIHQSFVEALGPSSAPVLFGGDVGAGRARR